MSAPRQAPKPTPKPGKSTGFGVGMPAALHLNEFGRQVYEAFGHHPYLVGSATRGKYWRDVDVRLILPDDEFDALFPDHDLRHADDTDPKWSLLCTALAELAKLRTGLPVDFQVQRRTQANEQYPSASNYRFALGLVVHRRSDP